MLRVGQLIKFEHGTVIFPSFCPVCGAPVTTEGAIPAISQLERHKAMAQDVRIGPYGAHSSPRLMPRLGSISRFFVPTCDEHGITFEEAARYRGPLALCSGLMVLLAVVICIWIILGYAAYTPLDSNAFLLLGIVIFIGIGTYYASGPTPLERAISVVDISPSLDTVILNIRDSNYIDEILRLNPLIAKRVKRVISYY